MKTLPPGSTIGILGGGQLGRMTALAAAKLGYRCHIYCLEASEPAVDVSSHHTIAAFDDAEALERFAKSVDVVTLEWENVPVKALQTIAAYTPVHPGPEVLKIAQNRVEEKIFARRIGIGTADFVALHSVTELEDALSKFSLPAILKSNRMGYDGKGQVKIMPGMLAEAAWKEMGSSEAILEAFVDFTCEVSVIVACRADGVAVAYPPVQNIHRNQILSETHAPAALEPALAREAEHLALRLAEKLGVIGLLAVEMFIRRYPDKNGHRILINEIAPRPHNSGHWTMDACACSQFEQLVRAVCGLPLGSTKPHSRAVMYNLIGDEVHEWPKLLTETGACLHLYGKTDARAGRKMGHVTHLKDQW